MITNSERTKRGHPDAITLLLLLLHESRTKQAILLSVLIFFLAPTTLAQLNWEGQTGGLLTPFAYTSKSPALGIGHPEVAFHYMNAGPVLGNEFQTSITVGFLKIGEIGFTRSFNAQGGPQKLVPNAGEKNHLVYIPLGVGIVIPPWNFAAAIMGGMTLAAIVTGSTAGEALVSHPKTRFIAFTGSKEAGNPVVALWMNQNAVVYTRGTTHHKGDAIMETPPRDPGDLGVAHGAGPALELPEKAKSPRTPKRFCHMISFAFFGAPGLSWRTEQVSQFATGRPYLADVGFQCEKLLLDVLEFGIAQIVQVGRIWLAVPESLGGHIQGREIIPDGNLFSVFWFP